MTSGKLMTQDEKRAVNMQYIALEKAGKHEEAMEVAKTRPLSPALAALIKKRLGVGWLKKSGWNLAEAEVKFGEGWLNK
jgi:hypothetical protein